MTPILLSSILQKLLALDKFTIGRTLRLFENDQKISLQKREELLSVLEKSSEKNAYLFGFTGPPGVGKSTLLSKLVHSWLSQDTDLKIAILAIDPTSQETHGSLLGDRIRQESHSFGKRLFFRSQPSSGVLGGTGRYTFQVCRLLRKLFDVVFVETVGVGQNEFHVQRIVDHSFLLLQPFTGDQVQFLKAGIMEIPDSIVLNKCEDAKLTRSTLAFLQSSEQILLHKKRRTIFQTSCIQNKGITDLCNHVKGLFQEGSCLPWKQKEASYFEEWLLEQYGQCGKRSYFSAVLEGLLPTESQSSLEAKQLFCLQHLQWNWKE